MEMWSRLSVVLLLLLLLLLCSSPSESAAQPKTDPSEVSALNSIFGHWSLKAASTWNLSGEPCSGWAVDDTEIDNNPAFNPGIKCDCSYSNNTVCHISKLKVYALDVVGPIPEELRNLTYLTNLNLGQNYLTGALPAFMGDFKAMQYLTVGINALSGEVPKELGKLQNIISLSIASNNFSGPVPAEFGNLITLNKLYMSTCGLSGELPPTLSRLKNLQIMWAVGNNFTGKIPDYIGSWSNMVDLRLQGNSFEGPIPSSLSNLVQLTTLRIGDIVKGSSSLSFINNMTSLSVLILRNCRISDIIPIEIGKFQKLQHLDLSFNNITGEIPQILFNLASLSFLFLGNNSIAGSLPYQKSAQLTSIDLSYNQLSGSFPSWVSEQNLQLNLVANNFVFDSSNSSILPSGLKYLQRDTPCHSNGPKNSNFAVKCGGSRDITASDGTVYHTDVANLGAASYYVTDDTSWGVSTAGRFVDGIQSPYIIMNNSSQIQNTLDTGLYQSARMSPSTLRYYGIGLENGNYTVELHFAEIVFPNQPTWKSVGTRIFDIYIQGELNEKDFNIKKEAGGKSFQAVVKRYVVPVPKNFLEIHFFWAGKGTCCIPTQGFYGPTISAIKVSPYDFTPTEYNTIKSKLIVAVVLGVISLATIAAGLLYIFVRRRRALAAKRKIVQSRTRGPQFFSFVELKSATDNFSAANIIGKGGYGTVYKGTLSNGTLVAIKQLSETSRQGKKEFTAEVTALSAVWHRNLVKLYGCCIETSKLLVVYEYFGNQSLDKVLFGNNGIMLSWSERFEICLGVASGLAYLHEESNPRIVHRDIKCSNILLDADLNPKISDFGLAKFYDETKTHVNTSPAGTLGYRAPEYAMRGHLNEKVDVFAFGVVALEIVSGRSISDETVDGNNSYLLEWAWRSHLGGRPLDILDPKLDSADGEEAARLISVALLCTQAAHHQRPAMSAVVSMLKGKLHARKVSAMPSYLVEYEADGSRGDVSQDEQRSDGAAADEECGGEVGEDDEDAPLSSCRSVRSSQN